MFKLIFEPPKSIINTLQKKYQDSHVESIVKDFLKELIQYCMDYSVCTIKGFGKFVMYKTYCNKTNMIRPRFKFRYSRSFLEKISKDTFVMEKLKMSLKKYSFNHNNKQRCSLYKDIRDANAKMIESSGYNDRENKRLAAQYIEELISDE
jgi:hypothetical protein